MKYFNMKTLSLCSAKTVELAYSILFMTLIVSLGIIQETIEEVEEKNNTGKKKKNEKAL